MLTTDICVYRNSFTNLCFTVIYLLYWFIFLLMSFKVGCLTCNRNEVIGSGDFGTSVFKGTYKKDEVAVKRILRHGFVTVDGKIISSILNATLKHRNIVQYYAFEKDLDFE